jgi:hypothetical protein
MSIKRQQAALRDALKLGKKLATVPKIPAILRRGSETKGWVIIHPNGRIETTYFDTKVWRVKDQWSEKLNAYRYVRVSRERWREVYRPDCHMVRATLSWKGIE